MDNQELFEASYEKGYLRRELGDVVTRPEIAITELVANAYDAGASAVSIIIPSDFGGTLLVEDDGTGMTADHIRKRWLKLRYSRLDHQGPNVAFPDVRKGIKRRAFGRNGIGRHGLFCFADHYHLETWRDGECNQLTIGVGDAQPVEVLERATTEREGHGTRLRVEVTQNFCSDQQIAEMLASRFLSMPDFSISVNGRQVILDDHPGVVASDWLTVGEVRLKVTVIDNKAASRTSKFKGLGVWVGGRRVGEMEWRLGRISFADGRRSFSLRFALIVETDGLRDEIREDWSGFKPGSEAVERVAAVLHAHINEKRKELMKDEVAETKREAINSTRDQLEELPTLAKQEISEFIDELLDESPDMKLDVLLLAVRAAINLEKSHHGQSLLGKLTTIAPDDVSALDQLLDDWTAKDALKVLSEIDARIKVIETLRRLSDDKEADELHTIHPLVLKARWLFGPEYESSEYSSNVGLVKTVAHVFGKRVDQSAFLNARKRPDIVVLNDASVGAQALEELDEDGIVSVKTVLLIEVKKGGFSIGRDELNQADGYVQDIVYSEILASRPFVNAIVVGDRIEPKTAKSKDIKDADDDSQKIGRVKAVTFANLISTAELRLFRLRDKLSERYEQFETHELQQEALTTTIPFRLQ